jgi:hypothetical protein
VSEAISRRASIARPRSARENPRDRHPDTGRPGRPRPQRRQRRSVRRLRPAGPKLSVAATGLVGPPRDLSRPALAHRRLDPPGTGSRRRLRTSCRDHADQAHGVAMKQAYLQLWHAPETCARREAIHRMGSATGPGRFAAHRPVRGAGRGSPSRQSALQPFCIARMAQNASKREMGDSPVRSRAIGS